MELLSGYSDAGVNAWNANQNMIGTNLMNSINNQMANQQQMMAASNAQSAAMARPTPYGYGFVPIATFGMSSPAAVAASNASRGISPSASAIGNANRAAAGWAPIGSGGIGGESARDQLARTMIPQYNASRQQGWMPNEGAPVPQQSEPWSMGQFKPHSYGWDHNEGAPEQPSFQQLWQDRGRVYQPPHVPSPYGPGGYPAMTPRGGEQQGNLNWFGQPNVSS